MAMLDEWGEEIQNMPDQGVFTETALGGDQVNFPNTNTTRFPYVATPKKQIRQISENKYALYGTPGMGSSVKQATAGMCGWADYAPATPAGGQAWDTSPLPSSEQPWVSSAGTGWGTSTSQPGMTGGEIAGAVTSGLNSVISAVGTGFQIYGGMEQMRAQRRQAASDLSMQMQMFQYQLEQQTLNAEQEREYRALMMEAEAALASETEDPTEMLAVLAAMQQAQSPSVLPWVLGGLAFVGLAGVVIYLIAKK
jgi:hypothetical protein